MTVCDVCESRVRQHTPQAFPIWDAKRGPLYTNDKVYCESCFKRVARAIRAAFSDQEYEKLMGHTDS